jgi:hypothetical protein
MTKYPALLTAAMAALFGFDSEAVPHAPGVLPGTNGDPEYRMSNVERLRGYNQSSMALFL